MGEIFAGLIILFVVSAIASAIKKKSGGISDILSDANKEEDIGIEELAQKFFDSERKKPATKNGTEADEAPDGALRGERPIIRHSANDCTGGSIHDGYHEGTEWKQGKAMPRKRPETAPEGVPVKGEDHSIHFKEAEVTEKHKSGAEKLTALLSEKPSIVQGIIWGELLGRPRSEQDTMQ